jgi:hypothetical protein
MNASSVRRRHTPRGRQRGITFLGWVVLLVPLAIVVYAGIRIGPSYLNYVRVSQAIDKTRQEWDAKPQSITREALVASLEKRFDTDYVENPKISEVSIFKTGDGWVIEAEYDEVVPLLANASILLTFAKSAEISL